MSGVWGRHLQISLFGESHGPGIGVVMGGLPSGLALDMEKVAGALARRAPGRDAVSTARKEADQPEILSGLYQGKTTGTPLAALIRNQDAHSEDYEDMARLMRPGHGDFPGWKRYKGFADPRGGGHFSGRLTAPLVFAGAVAQQILEEKGIMVCAHIQSIAQVEDLSYAKALGQKNDLRDVLDEPIRQALQEMRLPVLDPTCREAMEGAILEAKAAGDSVGGVVECAVLGLPPGVGEPFFDSVESVLASLLFSIPGVKGLEFGLGFEMTRRRGSQCNDPYYLDQGQVKTRTNHQGGILGGITNGAPLLFRVAMRPTPSISMPQETVDLLHHKETVIQIKGRHDPCIVPRAVPVIEAAAALAVCDLLKEAHGCGI